MPRDWDITGHPDGCAIWFEGQIIAVWRTLVCARAAMKLAQSAAGESNALLAATLAKMRTN